MRSQFLFSLLALISVLSGRFAYAEETQTLRVLSYNIHHGEGRDYIVDLQRVARVIRSVKPDLVALQEVDSGTERTLGLDQPQELARLTEMNFLFGDNIPYQGGRYGNVLLSRFPILRYENHPLKSLYQGEQRGVLEVEFQLPNEQSLLLLATHFDSRPNSCERLASAKEVNALIEHRSDTPALLIGDLNALPQSCTLRILGQQWIRAGCRYAPTYPALCPYKQIDYVMFRPANRWRVLETQVLGETMASDHRPTFAVLELSNSLDQPNVDQPNVDQPSAD
jgi:endonuclease/exonuclease/phosphatase family metal-dependent hydrolase